MIYMYNEDKTFIYVRCETCGKQGKIMHPVHVKKDPNLDHGEYYEYPNRIFNCNHADQYPNRVYKRNPNITPAGSNQVQCPHCGSTSVQLVQRGWKWTTGFIGSGKMERVCMNCMQKF